MEARRSAMIAKLSQRHKKPQATELSTKNGASDSVGSNEFQHVGGGDIASDFQRRFYKECSCIADDIERLRDRIDHESVDLVETKLTVLTPRFSKLLALLNESTPSLAPYETRKATNYLSDLQEKFKQIRLQLQPQKRFTFTYPKAPIKPTTSARQQGNSNGRTDYADCAKKPISTVQPSSTASVVIQGRRDEQTIVLSSDDCEGKDILLLECQSCTIRLLGISTTVHAKHLSDCTILCCPVSTSVFVEFCQRSTFVVACQQLRMHSSNDCDLYVHVTTGPIIEDCRKLRYAPYMETVADNVQELLEKSNLDKSKNYWNLINDFNWLVSDKPSPNWTILPNDQWRKYYIHPI